MPKTAPKGKTREEKISGHDYTQKCKPSTNQPQTKYNKRQTTKLGKTFPTQTSDKKLTYFNITVLQINTKEAKVPVE